MRTHTSYLFTAPYKPGQLLAGAYPAASASRAVAKNILFSVFICLPPGHVVRWYLLPDFDATYGPTFTGWGKIAVTAAADWVVVVGEVSTVGILEEAINRTVGLDSGLLWLRSPTENRPNPKDPTPTTTSKMAI